ncbi:MAG: M48 family metalloprotease [Thermodesulfovibrio sp.]|nr:M48 family metalloprotease [Thermodesulfovibrio sp.]
MKKKYIKTLFFLVFLFFISGCITEVDPLSGKKTYTLLSTEQEIKIGQKIIPSAINETEGVYPDPEVQKYIRDIGYKISSLTPRKVDYQFYIVNSSEVNAFALPGGPIFITRGLLLKMDKECELAGVLAHELGHINARHHAKFLEKNFGMSILLSILGIAIQDSGYASLVMTLAEVSASLLQLKFSRDQENEADTLGVDFSYKAGYDPKGLLIMFEKFKTLQRTTTVEWLSTHPLPDTRIKKVKEMISQRYPVSSRLIVDTEGFQRILTSVKATAESYEYVEKAKRYIRSANYYEALNLLDKAIQLYGSNQAYTYRAMVNMNLKRYKEAAEDADKAIKVDRLYFKPFLIKGISLTKLGQYSESINTLEKAKLLIGNNPDLYYWLGVDYQAVGDKFKAIDNLSTALQLTDGSRGWESDAKRRLRTLRGY